MERVDLVVRNGCLVTRDGMFPGGVAIDKGKVVAVAGDKFLPQGKEEIDAGGKPVLPGIIDPHAHLQAAYYTAEELMVSETRSAAAGGITTMIPVVFDRADPAASYKQFFPRFKEYTEAGASVDIALSGLVTVRRHVEEIAECALDFGITSYKHMMAYSGAEAEVFGVSAVDDGLIMESMRTLKKIGYPGIAMVHAENMDIVYWHKERLMASGRNDLAAYTEARPDYAEEENIRRALFYAELTGAPLYIVHMSIGAGVDLVAQALARGVNVVAETCYHYLFFTKDDDDKFGRMAKINPPLRARESCEKLLEGIERGIVTCTGSDQSTIMPKAEKMKQDLWSAIPGWPGTETMLPVLLSEGVNKGKLSLERLVQICCYGPAVTFGIYPQKGDLKVGADGDLVIIDLDKKQVVDPKKNLHSAADYSPYEGMELTGWPILTVLRGQVIMRDGQVLAKPGTGKYLPRKLA